MSRIPTTPDEIAASSGQSVGPYRLTRRIARGGMGDVWLAQRTDGLFRRPVAIKLMHGHLLEPNLEKRFQAEREILAALDHPHIARLVDGGVTVAGVPFVAMDYIDGQPIDDYCRHRHPSLPERLRLFRQVCAAVHYAHRNLVVHRDVKPGNILVTREGEVKLLDFGIAKLLRPELGSFTRAVTRPFDRLMTPEYASPEQLRGEPVSTATDVYSLGLLLTILVAGRLPYAVEGLDTNQIRQLVCEQEPQPLAELTNEPVPPDIAAIAAKALRKEPDSRYASAGQLSDDVGRYLDGFPVTAHHGRFTYLAGKFIQRHKLTVAFAAVLLSVLLSSGVMLTNLTRQYKQERDTAQAVEKFLIDLFDASDPNSTRANLPARALLDRGAAQLSAQFASQPEVEASLAEKIGDVYRQLGLYPQALPLFERSLALYQQVSGPQTERVAAVAIRLADLLREMNQNERAEQLVEQSLKIRRAILKPDDAMIADSLNILGILQQIRGNLAASRATFEEAVRIRRIALPPGHYHTALSLGNLGNVESGLGNLDTAEALFSEALAMRRATWGPRHPRVGSSLSQLAGVALRRGEVSRALTLSSEALAIERAAFQGENPALANTLLGAAAAKREAGLHREAEGLAREAVALELRFHPDSAQLSFAEGSLAAVLMEQGRLREAAPLVDHALRLRRQRLGPNHTSTVRALEQLAELRERSGQKKEAEEIYAQALAMRRQKLGDQHPDVLMTLFASGDRDHAIEKLRQRLPQAHNLEAKLWLQSARQSPARRAEFEAKARAALALATPADPVWQAQLRK